MRERGGVETVVQHPFEEREPQMDLPDAVHRAQQGVDALAQVVRGGYSATQRERMHILVAVRAAASGNDVHATVPGEVVLGVERDRERWIDLPEQPQIPVRGTADEHPIAYRIAQPREGPGRVPRPGRLVLRVEHEDGRTGGRGANDLERVAEQWHSRALARLVVSDHEFVATGSEIDLDASHALGKAFPDGGEGVRGMRSAPGAAVRFQL